VKPLADGSKAIGIFKMKPDYFNEEISSKFTLIWNSAGLSGSQSVHDLWRQKDLGVFDKSFTVSLPECGVSLIKVTSVKE
jgi:hypothetical protein